ncbi:MAG: MBL fold metallo-hydrolase [Defluviitaleaceae bacterium]|nr:MBL fold metallo-hydrolase [Defluviitaleaceae bacterium]
MKKTKISNRNTIFRTAENASYDLILGVILGRRHNFIIDTGMGSNNVAEMLDYIGADGKPIIAINTHAHGDHIFGNWVLENQTIVSHRLCREIIDREWDGKIKKEIDETKDFIDGEVRKCLPNLTFEGSISFPEDGITIFLSPFHTVDCISVYDAVDKVLYTGDNFGVIDGKAALWGEDLPACRNMIDTYRQYDFDICVPAHVLPGSDQPQPGREVLGLLEAALLEAERK